MSSETKRPGCIIVQSDLTILLETDHPLYEEARDVLSEFAEMVKSPEYIHTYKLTQLSLWNAASAGLRPERVVEELRRFSKHELPPIVVSRILDWGKRYGRVKLLIENGKFILRCDDEYIAAELENTKAVAKYLIKRIDAVTFEADIAYRGHIKQALILAEYPAEDLAGYREAAPLSFALRNTALSGQPFMPRPYQKEAVALFHANGEARGGHGVIVLPCGAGKTIVGMAAMEKLQTETLILTTAITAVRQWIAELLDKTTLTDSQIGEYSGEKKEIKPVTITTYQILGASEKHRELIDSRKWGLIIYDEVHTLPAPVFRMTAELQSKRRLGLTATLVREDGLQSDVFTLIGPKRYEVPWKVLEKSGYIAKVECFEVRIPLSESSRMDYAVADRRQKFESVTSSTGTTQFNKIHSGLNRRPPVRVMKTMDKGVASMNNEIIQTWNATLYLRLSREDGDKEESNSITGQRELLRDFLKAHPELHESAVRVDDGFSGSTFERPAFQAMLEDVKTGKTNCIIVKDLSRFGRNYLDAGEYIEKVFPFLGVRFIAVNDNYDSFKGRNASDDLIVPFKNLINEAYCRDISVKIRSQLDIKRRRGQFIGAFAVYGYRKDTENKNRLAVDDYAADIVRDIFKWKLEGVSPQDISGGIS